jgi:fluoride ion exporter CrcB/FEX
MANKRVSLGMKLGAVIGFGLFAAAHALPKPYGTMLDNVIGLIVLGLFLAVGGWVLFWWVRLRRWRRRTQAGSKLPSN